MAVFDAEELVGSLVGSGKRYRLNRVLGQRLDAVSFEGFADGKRDRRVVVRIVHGDMPTFTENKMAQRLLSLKHPRLVEYSDAQHAVIGDFGSRLILVRGLRPESLKQRIAGGQLSEASLRNVMLDVLDGLQVLHSKSLVHGDLRPNNIFPSKGARWQIADYSLGSLDVDERFVVFDEDVPFIAPEIADGHVSFASDIYSFGKLAEWLQENSLVWKDVDNETREAWAWAIKVASRKDPEDRPDAATMKDVLFSGGRETAGQVLSLVESPDTLLMAARDLNRRLALLPKAATVNSNDTEDALIFAVKRLRETLLARPYLSLGLKRIERLSHYIATLALAAPANIDYNSLLEGGSGKTVAEYDPNNANKWADLGLDIDEDWSSSIFDRYAELSSGSLALSTYGEENPDLVLPEVREALEPDLSLLLRQLKREVAAANHLRSEILAEETLLFSSEVALLLSRGVPDISVDEVRNMDQSRILLAIHDHGRALFPSFQFNRETGQAYSAVQRVNEVLHRGSGWAVVAWWRRYDRTLGGPPKMLLSEELADDIVALAKGSTTGP